MRLQISSSEWWAVCGSQKVATHWRALATYGAGVRSDVKGRFKSLLDSTTNIQGQLFSVGFVISGFSPSHAGCVADLPVLTA